MLNWVLAQSGSSGINWPQLIKIVIIVLFFSIGGLVKVYKAIKEKSEKERALATKRRLEEELRRVQPLATHKPTAAISAHPAERAPLAPATTMSMPTSDDEAKRRLAEIARRRREAMQKLAGGGGGGGGGGGSGGGIPSGPTPGQIMPRHAPMPSQPSQQQRQPMPMTQAQRKASVVGKPNKQPPARPSQSRAPQPRQSSQSQTQLVPTSRGGDYHSVSQAADEPAGQVHRLVQDRPEAAPPVRPTILSQLRLTGGNPAEVRRAMILSEIFSRPVSERADHLADV